MFTFEQLTAPDINLYDLFPSITVNLPGGKMTAIVMGTPADDKAAHKDRIRVEAEEYVVNGIAHRVSVYVRWENDEWRQDYGCTWIRRVGGILQPDPTDAGRKGCVAAAVLAAETLDQSIPDWRHVRDLIEVAERYRAAVSGVAAARAEVERRDKEATESEVLLKAKLLVGRK